MAFRWITVGALYCALAIVAGAFGAHGLKSRLDVDALALWETAARYLMYSGVGIVLIGLARLQARQDHDVQQVPKAWRGFDIAAAMLCVGAIIFSGTVGVLALGGPRWLGAVTPLGGLLLVLGFVIFGAKAWRF